MLHIVNKLQLLNNGLVVKGTKQTVHLQQGTMDGACAIYSMMMCLIIIRSIHRNDVVSLDDDRREVVVDGEKIVLTLKEYELLKYLMQNANIAVSREALLTNIWGYDFFGDDRTVDTHIKTLRSKIGQYKDNLVTLRGVGYKFETQDK